jgi:cation transport ATPase
MESQVSLKEIKCKNCGANLIFDENKQLYICDFCHSSYKIETDTNERQKKDKIDYLKDDSNKIELPPPEIQELIDERQRQKDKKELLKKETNKVTGRGCFIMVVALVILGAIANALKDEIPVNSPIPGIIYVVVIFLIGRSMYKKYNNIKKQEKDIKK